MAIATALYTSDQSVTITLASLANNTFATSSTIDNGTNKFLEAIVQVKIRTASSGVSSTGFVNVFYLRSADNGTTFDDNNKLLLGSFAANAVSTTYIASFSTLPHGTLARQWRVAVENRTGAALTSTAADHEVQFEGIRIDIS